MKLSILVLIFFSFQNLIAQDLNSIIELDYETLDLIIDFGKTYKGTTYNYGSCEPKNGFDCSGFIHYIFKMAGFDLPRSSREMSKIGSQIDLALLEKGDLLFYNTLKKETVSHVGIVSEINEKQIIMLHVSSSKGVQEIDILSSDYWYSRLLLAKKIN